MTDRIKLFVGCAANGEDAESQAVLEYTARGLSSLPIDITWLALSRDATSPMGGWDTAGWGTPFTALRWAVPHLCGFKGRAIYMDSDMIVRADLAELWNQPMPDGAFALLRKTAAGKPRCCVMLLDCERARDSIPKLAALKSMRLQHGATIQRLRDKPSLSAEFAGNWNAVDPRDIGDPGIKIIHYSSMPTQPQLTHAKPRLARKGLKHWYDGETGPHPNPDMQVLFDSLLEAAKRAGYRPENYEPATPYGVYRKFSFAGKPIWRKSA